MIQPRVPASGGDGSTMNRAPATIVVDRPPLEEVIHPWA